MSRKLGLILAATALAAFASPAIASAAPEVTVGGSRAPLGTSLEFHSLNFKIQTNVGNIVCETVATEVELTSNTGTHFAGGAPVENFHVVNCKLGNNFILATEVDFFSFTSSSSGSGKSAVTFEFDLPGPLNCHFVSTSAPYTYTSGGNSIKFTNANLVGSPAACEPGLFSADITLTSSGGAVVLH